MTEIGGSANERAILGRILEDVFYAALKITKDGGTGWSRPHSHP